MVRRYLYPSPKGQYLCFVFFLLTLCLLSSFVPLQLLVCFKPALDFQNFPLPSGKPECVTTVCPLLKWTADSSREKSWIWASLGLGLRLASVITTWPGVSDEGTRQHGQKHGHHLAHTRPGPRAVPCVSDLAPQHSPGRGGRRAEKEETRLQTEAEQEVRDSPKSAFLT